MQLHPLLLTCRAPLFAVILGLYSVVCTCLEDKMNPHDFSNNEELYNLAKEFIDFNYRAVVAYFVKTTSVYKYIYKSRCPMMAK